MTFFFLIFCLLSNRFFLKLAWYQLFFLFSLFVQIKKKKVKHFIIYECLWAFLLGLASFRYILKAKNVIVIFLLEVRKEVFEFMRFLLFLIFRIRVEFLSFSTPVFDYFFKNKPSFGKRVKIGWNGGINRFL